MKQPRKKQTMLKVGVAIPRALYTALKRKHGTKGERFNLSLTLRKIARESLEDTK